MAANSETTPLLGSASESLANLLPETRRNRNRNSIWRKYRLDVWIPIVLLTSLLISGISIFFMRVEPTLGECIAQGTKFDSDEVNFLGITDDGGIQLLVKGTNFNNYSQIADSVSREYFKTGGFALRQLNLKIQDLDLEVKDETKGDYKKLGHVVIQPFAVKIYDLAQTDLQLYMTVYPNADGVLGIIKRLISDPDSEFRLQGDADVRVLMFNGYIPITNLIIPLDIQLPTYLISKLSKEDIKLDNLKLSDADEKKLNCDFNLIMNKNPVEKLFSFIKVDSFRVPELHWKMIINDCENRPTLTMASLKSYNFELHPIKKTDNLNVSATLSFDSDSESKLSKKCATDDNSTPLSRLIDAIVNDDVIDFMIVGNSVKSVNSPLLNRVFQKIEVPMSLPFNTSDISSRYLENVTMEDLSFEIRDSTTPLISGDLKIFLNLGNMEIKDFEVNKIKGTADLVYQSNKFSDLNITNWKDTKTTVITENNIHYVLIESKLSDIYLNITDMVLFQSIVQRVLHDGVVKVDINALVDVLVNFVLGEFEIDSIPGSGTADFGI